MTPQIVVGSFIVKNDQFLFGKRTNTKSWYAGLWDLIGGHAMPGESPVDALQRELDEELGIIATNYELVAVVDVLKEPLTAPLKYHVYVITAWSGTPSNRGDEHEEINWFTRDELDKIQLASEKYLAFIDTWLVKRAG